MTTTAQSELEQLETLVRVRLADGDPTSSYVADVAAKGRSALARKLGEEAVETVIAAMQDDDRALIGEAADLVFHLTLLLAERGLGWAEIIAELARRRGTSGHAEKAARSKP